VSLLLDDDGFTFDGTAVRWSSVRAVVTYKWDLLTCDDICLGFRVGDDAWVEVSEEEPGFDRLVAEVERRYPGVARDWFREAMRPAFATKLSRPLGRGMTAVPRASGR
jgi:hypothetical protein